MAMRSLKVTGRCVFLVAALGLIGGCGTTIVSFASLSTLPGLPSGGNYRVTNPAGGGVLMTVDEYGNLQICASGSAGIFTGTTTINQQFTFSSNLAGPGGQTTAVSGSTYSNNIKVSLTGPLTASNLIATSSGAVNPFVGSFTGTISGGTVGSNQPLSFTVANSPLPNVTGTMNSAAQGSLTLGGTISVIGAFAAAPAGSGGEGIILSGNLGIGVTGALQGSGIWVDVSNATNNGTWSVVEGTANAGQARRPGVAKAAIGRL